MGYAGRSEHRLSRLSGMRNLHFRVRCKWPKQLSYVLNLSEAKAYPYEDFRLSDGTATPHQQYDPDLGKGDRYPASTFSIAKPPFSRRSGISRVTWQPSKAQRNSGSVRFCQRCTDGSGESPCSKNMNLPRDLRTRPTPAIASTTPGIVHKLKVLTTVSTLAAGSGMFSPGRPRNSTLSLVFRRCSSARRSIPGFGSKA